MSESERRRKYRWDCVLIETDRLLNPQFDDAVVYLTGAQLEMLRNTTQNLRRPETYVSEYAMGYYLTPTVEDYDSILAIVADLEEVLMGNPNTIWGYNERWIDRQETTGSGTNDVWLTCGTVPNGEVWVIEEAYMYHLADTTKVVRIYIDADSELFYLVNFPSASPIIEHRWQGSLTLSYGDEIGVWVIAPGDGKYVHFAVYGYKMVVPET